jgi:hypothetical protein
MAGGRPARPLRERLHNLADKNGPVPQNRPDLGPCWVWHLRPNRDGYGTIAVTRYSKKLAHRAMYEIEVGPIPDGMELDHLCRNRLCVNFAHLEAVTHRVNTRRGKGSVPACPRGHLYDEVNTYWKTRSDGIVHRDCRACGRERATPTCGNGHPWMPENTHYNSAGRRQCAICRPPKSFRAAA